MARRPSDHHRAKPVEAWSKCEEKFPSSLETIIFFVTKDLFQVVSRTGCPPRAQRHENKPERLGEKLAAGSIFSSHSQMIGRDHGSSSLSPLLTASCGNLSACFILRHFKKNWSLHVSSLPFTWGWHFSASAGISWLPSEMNALTISGGKKTKQRCQSPFKTSEMPFPAFCSRTSGFWASSLDF